MEETGAIFHIYLTPDLWMQCLLSPIVCDPNPLILTAFFFVWGPMNNII